MAHNKNNVDMINGPLWNKILKFSVLFMLTTLLQHLYSAADIVVVGRYAGKDALAGVGTCSHIVNLFVNFIVGLSAGVSILLGQALGSGRKDEISKASHTAIALSIIGGTFISVICLLFTEELLKLVDVPLEVMKHAADYLRVTAVGFIPTLIYNFGSAIVRAKGDTKRPLYIVLVSGFMNVILNLLFVCVFKMGAAGVALATTISNIINAVSILYILTKETDETRIYLGNIRPYKTEILKILKYGLPSGIQTSIFSLSNLLVQSSVNSFGAAATAGSAASSSITGFYEGILSSQYQASIVFTSQNYGAKKFDRIKKTFWICMGYVMIFWTIQIFITYFFGRDLIELYAPGEPQVVDYALRKMRILGYTNGLIGVMNVFTGGLRGMGASFMNLVTSVAGVCGIRIVWILTVFKYFATYDVLMLCYPVSWIGTNIFHMIMFIYIYKKEKKKVTIT